MNTNIYYMFTKYQRLTVMVIAIISITACSPDESTETSDKQKSTETLPSQNNFVATPIEHLIAAPKACESGQISIETGYQNFPDMECSQIANKIEATYTTNIGYRKQCQQKTGANSRPKSVARVQIKECAPLRQEDGNYASMLVCCHITEPEVVPEIISYDTKLECPENHVQALTALHYPQKKCAHAVTDAESALNSSHYQRACTSAAALYTKQRQTVLDAAVFTCREDVGSYIDVAICCSATLPKGKKMHPLEVPSDIWEVLRTNDIFALKLLLSRQPERAVEQGERGITPLHRAGSLAAVNVLLLMHANHNAKDLDGLTPLHSAVMRSQYDIVARLLKVGAKVDAASIHGDTPLSFVKTRKIAELLLSHKANVNGVGSSESAGTPLHSAAFYGRADVTELLLEHGANINSHDANGETPLHRAAFAYSKKSINAVRILIENGADINAKNNQGKRPLDMTNNVEIRTLISSNGGISEK